MAKVAITIVSSHGLQARTKDWRVVNGKCVISLATLKARSSKFSDLLREYWAYAIVNGVKLPIVKQVSNSNW